MACGLYWSGLDQLAILSEWVGEESALSLLAAKSGDYYDRIHLSPPVSGGRDIKVFFSEEAKPRVEKIEVIKNPYQVLRLSEY